MKRPLFKLIIITVLLSSVFTIKSNAQEIKLGGGLIIGTDLPPLGLQFKGTYGMDMLLENLSGSLEFAIFFPSSKNNYDHSRWSIDVDGNYIFWNASGFDFYAIAGLNITHYAKKYTGALVNIPDDIGTKPGLNAGAGVNYKFSSNLSAFSEVKYVLSNFDQAAFNFGVLFEL
ncbi:MAG: outer membrane beta-barrel protein [Bacteroidales bacterium]|nr:outer membrane beta-barrel protein [Bacteroidales bacterium]